MEDLQDIKKLEFDKVTQDIVRFIRGKYELDEVGEKDKINLKNGQTIIFSIHLYNNKYDFEIIFNNDECKTLEQNLNSYASEIIDAYNNSFGLENKKHFKYVVKNIEDMNKLKPLIEFKFKPNRKPFAKENAIIGKCGHRCDLCIHFSDMDEKLRNKITENLTHVYNVDDWSMRCSGCNTPGCYVEDGECVQVKCAYEKNYEACVECDIYPCKKATVGYQILEPRSIKADDVTWGILPFVPYQYGN